MLKIYTDNSFLNEGYNFTPFGNGKLNNLQKSIYFQLPAFKQKAVTGFETLGEFYAHKINQNGDYSKENLIEQTITLSNTYIKLVDGFWYLSTTDLSECLKAGIYYLEFKTYLYETYTDVLTFYSEPFEMILPICEVLETFTTTNTYIKFFDIIAGGLQVNCYVGNDYSFLQVQANYGGSWLNVGSLTRIVDKDTLTPVNVLFDLTGLVALRIRVWVNEICQVFDSTPIAYGKLEQNIFNSLGIGTPNIILNNTVWALDAKIYGGYGLKSDTTATIILFDDTKIIDPSTIRIVGTCTVINVVGGIINFSAGNLSYLKFKDTLGVDYEFPICESNGNVIHNIYTTCNALFDNFYWNENNEYFGLMYNDFEVLPNSLGTLKVYIPKKLNGSSNFLS